MKKEELVDNSDINKRRRRDQPQRKWSKEETVKILDYILSVGIFEKPTARVFYQKLVEVQQMDVHWELVKYRVKNLKNSFRRANEIWNSSRNGEIKVATAKAKIEKICPHYNQLKDIFGSGSHIETKFSVDTMDICNESQSSEHVLFETVELKPSPLAPIITCPSLPTSPLASPRFKEAVPSNSRQEALYEEHRRRTPKSHFQEILDMEDKRNGFMERRLEIEKEKMDIERKRLKLEEDVQMRKLEIEQNMQVMKIKIEEEKIRNDFELKKMELDQKERIAKYELDLKYKVVYS